MYYPVEYFSGKCSFQKDVENYTMGVDKIDVTSIEEKIHSYEYGNIKCDYANKHHLNCETCSILEQNGIKRFECFQ